MKPVTGVVTGPPSYTEDKELFEAVRGTRSYSHDSLDFRQQFSRALKLCRQVRATLHVSCPHC